MFDAPHSRQEIQDARGVEAPADPGDLSLRYIQSASVTPAETAAVQAAPPALGRLVVEVAYDADRDDTAAVLTPDTQTETGPATPSKIAAEHTALQPPADHSGAGGEPPIETPPAGGQPFEERPPHDATIRAVTPAGLTTDLETQRLVMPPSRVDGLDKAIGSGNVSFFVAESPTGEPRGQIGVNWGAPRTEAIRERLGNAPGIAFLEVPEAHRGQGIASDLLTTVCNEAISRGHAKVFLAVGINNETAIRLYQRHGFENSGPALSLPDNVRQPDGSYLQEFVDHYVLFKELTQ